MKGTRNKRKINSSISEDEFNKSNNFSDNNNLEKINDSLSDDFSDDSNLGDEIDRKINAAKEKSQNNLLKEENQDEFYQKDKIKKQKYEKKIKKDKFNDYFDSYNNKIDDYYEVNYPELSKYELKIDVYSDLFKLISKNKIFQTLFY